MPSKGYAIRLRAICGASFALPRNGRLHRVSDTRWLAAVGDRRFRRKAEILMNRTFRILMLILAVIGAIAVAIALGMWLMHLSMMRGDMMGPE